jgi:hypothetical protein
MLITRSNNILALPIVIKDAMELHICLNIPEYKTQQSQYYA